MTILKKFGFAIIWCIFGCGCVFNRPQQIDLNNKPQYYARLYTESVISNIRNTNTHNLKGAKQAQADAHKYWKAYLDARHNGERTYLLHNNK